MEKIRNILQFIREAKEELKKVTWPSKDEVTSFTIVVLVAVIFISVLLWLIDSGLTYIFALVIK